MRKNDFYLFFRFFGKYFQKKYDFNVFYTPLYTICILKDVIKYNKVGY